MILYHGTNSDFSQINLGKTKPYKDFGKGSHQYDVVIGPIADDGVAYLLNLYEEGLRTLEELAKELEYKDLNNQFCFLTDRAISLLHRVK